MASIKESLNFANLDLIKQILFSNYFVPALPYKMTFALTYRCNLRCKHCKTWERAGKDELSLDSIRSILHSANGLRWLHFTGGEIFLREDIDEIFCFLAAEKKLAILTFATNGFLTEKILKTVGSLAGKLRKTKLIITCSMDGVKEVHNALRGHGEAYVRCMETFMKLRAMGHTSTYLGVTVSKDNYELPLLISGLKEKMADFSFDELHFNFAQKSFFYNNVTPSPTEELVDHDVYSLVSKLRKTHGRKGVQVKMLLEDRFFELMAKYLKNKKPPLRCSAFGSSCFVDPYGDVYSCINYEAKIGSLKSANYNFKDFWETFAGRRSVVRDLINSNKCPGCWTSCEAYPTILSNLLPRFN